jgi:hypothetical protein
MNDLNQGFFMGIAASFIIIIVGTFFYNLIFPEHPAKCEILDKMCARYNSDGWMIGGESAGIYYCHEPEMNDTGIPWVYSKQNEQTR